MDEKSPETSTETNMPADAGANNQDSPEQQNRRSESGNHAPPAIGSAGPIPPPPVAKPRIGDTRPATGDESSQGDGEPGAGSGKRRRRRRGGRGRGGGQGQQDKQDQGGGQNRFCVWP